MAQRESKGSHCQNPSTSDRACNDDDDDDPSQDSAIPKAQHYHALSYNLDNGLDSHSALNRTSDLCSSPNLDPPENYATTWDTMTGYLPCSILSFFQLFERRKDSRYITECWIWMRSSCGIMMESTLALWVIPVSFLLGYWSLQLVESILPTILPMTTMLLFHDWKHHGSSSTTMSMTNTITTLPRLEGFFLLAATMVLLAGLGSLCSWIETEFLNNMTDQPLVPVWNLTILVPPDMARNWMHYEKRFSHQIVSRIGHVEYSMNMYSS